MATQSLKQRQTNAPTSVGNSGTNGVEKMVNESHPGGKVKHGGFVQLLRLLLLLSFFMASCVTIVTTQLLGSPLYWINKDLYYAYMSLTKRSFGILITSMTSWWSPTVIRVSGDASVAGQLRQTVDGRLECHFPDRIVMIANHQLYSDWLYLWWIAYANQPQMHGHIYIILKESLKYIPIIGQGMMFYGFIFMSRKMATDQARLAHRLEKLKERHSGPLSGSAGYDPMWLLLFPEGTNASNNSRNKSAQWAEKIGVQDMQHVLLPRSTGTFFCLNELKGTVDYVYDCTVAYEGVPRGKFGQDYFTLRAYYLQGRPPKSVNMYWRRFAIADMPLDDPQKFELWLRDRWYEKDALMEEYMKTGRFPEPKGVMNGNATKDAVKSRLIETEVKSNHWWEVLLIFQVLAAFALVANILARVWNVIFYGNQKGYQV
ncbi:acyltransferase-domain-containing protein [Xylogone sp. PMI_703]|nr:acyltransferase-domain-containing protein [Xylogone sp. PMI_703]